MSVNKKKCCAALAVLLILSLGCMFAANYLQNDGGKVDVSVGSFEGAGGTLVYKLYKPVTATPEHPAPAVLLLHGYQNDHETCAAYAIELARRGAVVMALDEFGHGATTVGLAARGYVNHKVTVNYGEDSEADGSFTKIGGANRYRIMMNFSNLDFFDDRYVTDSDGNRLGDTSCGGVLAYQALADMDIVDESRMAVSGHSMGTWSSWTVAAAYSGTEIAPKAVVLQCGELFTDDAYDTERYTFNNVLLLQAKYDEFSYFRDYKLNVTDDLLRSDLRTGFLGCTADEAAWNTTYGSFADGTARRIELLNTNHRLTTHHRGGLAAALAWFDEAIGLEKSVGYADQTAMIKEYLVLAAMLFVLFAMLPLMELLLSTKLFASVRQPLPPEDTVKPTGRRIRAGIITVLIAAATFPFMTQLGHGLLPLPENIFRMTVGNGFLSWYTLLILIMLFTNFTAKRGAKKRGEESNLYTMGLTSSEKKDRLDIGLYLKSLLLMICMVGMVYLVNMAYTYAFDLDLRFIWPFFRVFTLDRAIQFCVYFLFFAVFYLLNNSKIMAGLRVKASYRPGLGGFLNTWWRHFLVMAGGVLVVTLIEYIPFFMGIGPGADVLFGSTFGGPFMSLLILFVPQVAFFSVLCTYCYRRTGTVLPGALATAAIACWIVTGGSAML